MAVQRRQQSPLLQHRFTSAANQLEDLDDKLHFADAARAELDIVLQSPTAHLTGDHSLHVTQRLNHAEINIAAEDKRTAAWRAARWRKRHRYRP